MKTVNLDPEHQLDVTRGRKSTLRSGSSGITVHDGTTTGTQIWDVTVIGGTWTVGEDGTAVLTIGSGNVLLPEATITATKDTGNPTFNFASIPENMLKVGSTYYCPYTVAPIGDIRLATASDRDGPWTAGSVILAESTVTWRGAANLYAPHVMEKDGTFYLFYSAVISGGGTNALNAIGYATASAVTGTYTDHGSAVLSPSAAGLWDSRRVGEANVIFHGGQWVMAYMGEDSDLAYQASEQVGIATAPDPAGPWTRAAGNPVIGFGASGQWDDALIADPDIFYANGYYWIWYAGGIDAGPSTRAEEGLAYATSPTGPYTRHPDNPILTVGASGTWDDVWVFRGGMYIEDGQWGGTYAGYDGTNFKGGNFRLDIDSGAVSVSPTAADIPIGDGGGYFTGAEVESALQEIGAELEDVVSASGAVGELLISDAATSPIVFADILQNETETDLLYGDVT